MLSPIRPLTWVRSPLGETKVSSILGEREISMTTHRGGNGSDSVERDAGVEENAYKSSTGWLHQVMVLTEAREKRDKQRGHEKQRRSSLYKKEF